MQGKIFTYSFRFYSTSVKDTKCIVINLSVIFIRNYKSVILTALVVPALRTQRRVTRDKVLPSRERCSTNAFEIFNQAACNKGAHRARLYLRAIYAFLLNYVRSEKEANRSPSVASSRLGDDDDDDLSAYKKECLLSIARKVGSSKRAQAVFGSGYFLQELASEFPYVPIDVFNGVETARSVVGISPGSVSRDSYIYRERGTPHYRGGDNYDPRPR